MGSVWKCLGSILATYVFYLFFLWNCVRVNKAVTMGAVEQRLWQRDTDWDVVVAERPNWMLALPAVAPRLVPNRHLRSFPMRVSAHRYMHSSRRVFTTTCWFLLICFLSGRGKGRVPVGLCWTREAAEGGLKHSHMQPESPVWQIAPGLDFFLHWADVVSHLFSLVIIPH